MLWVFIRIMDKARFPGLDLHFSVWRSAAEHFHSGGVTAFISFDKLSDDQKSHTMTRCLPTHRRD